MEEKSHLAASIVLGAIIIAAGLYLGLTGRNSSHSSISPSPSPSSVNKENFSPAAATVTASPSAAVSVSPSPSSSPDGISYQEADLLAALAAKTGIPASEISYSVGEQVEKEGRLLLKGSFSRQGEMGGAGFFAVVDSHHVQVTYAGQGVPDCSEVNPYGYPLSWADYCVNAQGQTVAR